MFLHASCVALASKGVLISGPSGSGKSELALCLIDQGAWLVSDDQTFLSSNGQDLIASPPSTLEGLLEVRHVGIIKLPFLKSIVVRLYIELVQNANEIDRMPESDDIFFLDRTLQRLRLPAEPAIVAPKIRAFLNYPKMND